MKKILVLLGIIFVSIFSQSNEVYAESECTIFHEHVGNANEGGGCYTKSYTITSMEKAVCKPWELFTNQTQLTCSECKQQVIWYTTYLMHACNRGQTQYHHYTSCGCFDYYDDSMNEHTYDKEITKTVHQLDCGMDENTKIATISITPSAENWTNEDVILTVTSEGAEIVECDWSKHAEKSLIVDENGEYYCTVSVLDNGVEISRTLNYIVKNIDKEIPKLILSVEGNTIIADYSDDVSGITDIEWSTGEKTGEITVSENGVYSCIVTDNAGNYLIKEICVDWMPMYVFDIHEIDDTLASLWEIVIKLVDEVVASEQISHAIAGSDGVLKDSGYNGELIVSILNHILEEENCYDEFYAFKKRLGSFKIFIDNNNPNVPISQKDSTTSLLSVAFKYGSTAYYIFADGECYSMTNTAWNKYGKQFPYFTDKSDECLPQGIIRIN